MQNIPALDPDQLVLLLCVNIYTHLVQNSIKTDQICLYVR